MSLRKLKNQRGQSTVEYVGMLVLVVTILLFVFNYLKHNQYFFKQVTSPLVSYLRFNYKYGDPSAQGWDEGTPRKHIQISQPGAGQTFRLFQGRDK